MVSGKFFRFHRHFPARRRNCSSHPSTDKIAVPIDHVVISPPSHRAWMILRASAAQVIDQPRLNDATNVAATGIRFACFSKIRG
jgi:hypothetical protein